MSSFGTYYIYAQPPRGTMRYRQVRNPMMGGQVLWYGKQKALEKHEAEASADEVTSKAQICRKIESFSRQKRLPRGTSLCKDTPVSEGVCGEPK